MHPDASLSTSHESLPHYRQAGKETLEQFNSMLTGEMYKQATLQQSIIAAPVLLSPGSKGHLAVDPNVCDK